jgi:hypothetical protein
MYQTLKNNLSIRWTTFSVEFKRRWNIIFEERSIEDIRNDYLRGLWISKEELMRLKEWETQEFIKEYQLLRGQYLDLLSGFNMNALSNYHLLERKNQGKM